MLGVCFFARRIALPPRHARALAGYAAMAHASAAGHGAAPRRLLLAPERERAALHARRTGASGRPTPLECSLALSSPLEPGRVSHQTMCQGRMPLPGHPGAGKGGASQRGPGPGSRVTLASGTVAQMGLGEGLADWATQSVSHGPLSESQATAAFAGGARRTTGGVRQPRPSVALGRLSRRGRCCGPTRSGLSHSRERSPAHAPAGRRSLTHCAVLVPSSVMRWTDAKSSQPLSRVMRRNRAGDLGICQVRPHPPALVLSHALGCMPMHGLGIGAALPRTRLHQHAPALDKHSAQLCESPARTSTDQHAAALAARTHASRTAIWQPRKHRPQPHSQPQLCTHMHPNSAKRT